MLKHLGFKGGGIRAPNHPKYMVDFVVHGFHGDLLNGNLGLFLPQDLHENNAISILQIIVQN